MSLSGEYSIVRGKISGESGLHSAGGTPQWDLARNPGRGRGTQDQVLPNWDMRMQMIGSSCVWSLDSSWRTVVHQIPSEGESVVDTLAETSEEVLGMEFPC